MTRAMRAAAAWWTVPPARQVSYLLNVDPELLSIALDPLPDGAPAVVQFRPATGGPLSDQASVLLDSLDRAAVALFPRWLPGAERLDGPHALGVRAVRAMALREAARSQHFGPFLVDLAVRGLRGQADSSARFPAEVRAAGLARIIASAYGRTSAAVLIEVPEGLPPAGERALTAAAEWLVHHGEFTVWLAGAPLNAVDRVRSVAITLPAAMTQLIVEARTAGLDQPATKSASPMGPILAYPPVSGLPRKDSPAEQALERALVRYPWALGRKWNHTYEWHILGKPYRLDLFWAAERLVVEVDGPEHRGPLTFADDRRRDVQLQLRGNNVLRFTNEQVLSDVHGVVLKIKELLLQRRADGARDREMRPYVNH